MPVRKFSLFSIIKLPVASETSITTSRKLFSCSTSFLPPLPRLLQSSNSLRRKAYSLNSVVSIWKLTICCHTGHFKDGEKVCDIISEPFLFQTTIVMVIALYILWFYSIWFTCFKNLLCQNFLFPYGIESGVIFSEWKHSVLRFSSWRNLSELVM